MTSEVAKLTYRSVINLLEGNREGFEQLATQAMAISGRQACACGGDVIGCKYGHKNHFNKAKICTKCGTVYLDDKKIVRGIVQ